MKTRERVVTFAKLLAAGPSWGAGNVRRLHASLGVASQPRQTIHEEGAAEVYYFPPTAPRLVGAPPLLLVPSLINRWYVLDLLPGHSLVQALAAMGHAVYVLAWRDPHAGLGTWELGDYLEGPLRRAVLRVARHADAASVSLLGQCLGGDLTLGFAALHPELVDRLVTLTTPVDFRQGGLLSQWTRPELVDAGRIRQLYPGVVPDEVVYGAFPLLNPRALLTRHRVLFQMLQYEEFRRVYQAIDLWTTEHLPVASGALYGIVRDLYQRNALWEGTWAPGGRSVDLGQVRCPLLSVVAKEDDIAPLASTQPLLERVGSARKQEYVSPMGHITLLVGSPLRAATYQAIGEFCR